MVAIKMKIRELLHVIHKKNSIILLMGLLSSSCFKNSGVTEDEDVQINTAQKIVIIGSSIASGVGATKYDSSWSGRLAIAYKGKFVVVNLAKGGYRTDNIVPTPIKLGNQNTVDTTCNVDAAIKMHPLCIIVSMTTNDVAQGTPVAEIIDNLKIIKTYANQQKVKYIFITTAFPRNLNGSATALYALQSTETLKEFGKMGIDIYSPFVGLNYLPIKTYLYSDGLHPNNIGHKIIFDSVSTVLARNNKVFALKK